MTRLTFVGDSISKMADQRLPSGVVRRWRPPQGWNGALVQVQNNGTFGFGNVISTPGNTVRLGYEFDDGAANRVGENPLAPGTIMEWAIEDDIPGVGSLLRFQIRSSRWAGPDGPGWMARDDFRARLIYVCGPFGVQDSMDLAPYDIGGELRGEEVLVNDALETQDVVWMDHLTGQRSRYEPPISNVEFRVRHRDVTEEPGTGHILLGCRIYLDDPTGFELSTLSAGGTSPADWADESLCSNVQLGRMFEACGTNVVLLYLGANSGGDKATYKTHMTEVALRVEAALGAYAHQEAPIVLMMSQHDMGGMRDTQAWAEACFEIARERGQAQSDVMYSFLNLHDLIIEQLGTWEKIHETHMNDEVHPNQRGADDFMAIAEAEILRGPRAPLHVESYRCVNARVTGGGLPDLRWSDDHRLVVQATAAASPRYPGLMVEAATQTSLAQLQKLTMLIEMGAAQDSISGSVDLFNFDASQWVCVDEWSVSVGVDVTRCISIDIAADSFVEDATGAIVSRLHFAREPSPGPLWSVSFDQILWEVTGSP